MISKTNHHNRLLSSIASIDEITPNTKIIDDPSQYANNPSGNWHHEPKKLPSAERFFLLREN